MFAHDMKWTEDLLMQKLCDRQRQIRLAMYALHCHAGHSLYCKIIKLSTIKQYVRAAASFVKLWSPDRMDPRCDEPNTDKTGHILAKVYKEMERYEKMPERQEPFTITMLDFAIDMAKDADPDSMLAALADWYIVGLHLGLRKGEWAQPQNSMKQILKYALDVFGDSRAFTIIDLQVETKKGARRKSHSITAVNVEILAKIWVTFRTQKNGDNGDKKLLLANTENPKRCAVRAFYRIIERFQRLMGTSDEATPLAMYATSAGPQFVTPDVIEKHMRTIAAHVHNLDPVKDKDELARWSSHSLRIGACVILYTMGFTETHLKFLLRWKSDAFMSYLRNVAAVAQQQTLALDKAAAMPLFLR